MDSFITDNSEDFLQMVHRANIDKERIVITTQGQPVAALVPIENLRALEEFEEAQDVLDAKTALAESERDGTVSLRELKEQLGLRESFVVKIARRDKVYR